MTLTQSEIIIKTMVKCSASRKHYNDMKEKLRKGKITEDEVNQAFDNWEKWSHAIDCLNEIFQEATIEQK